MRPNAPAPPGSTATRTSERRRTYLDVALVALVALTLRIPAVVAQRHHHPDDGTYGVSAIAMRAGGVPFRDVFSSQGPLHLPLIWLFDLVRTDWSPRLSSMLAGVALAVVTYAIGRRISSRSGAVIAALLVATSGSLLWTTGPITSDGPTALFVALTFLLALRMRTSPAPGVALALGAAGAAAILLKPALGILGCAGAAVLVARSRPRRPLLIAAGTAITIGLALTLAFGLSNVWDQAIRYQLDSERVQSVGANAAKVVSTLWDRDLPILAAAAVAVTALVVDRRSSREPRPPAADPAIDRALLVWVGLLVVFLVVQPALWRNHLAALAVPLSLLAVRRPGACPWIVAAAVLAAPLHVARISDILDPPPYGGPTEAAWSALRALPDDAQALSDEVGIVWRAGLRTPDDFVDASIKQLEQGRITTERIAATAASDPVCAVLVWRSTHWGSLEDLPAALAAVGYDPVERFEGQDGARVLYLRPPCQS